MIEIKNISVGYQNKSVLCDVTVSFEKEKLTSVVGANGCGKSTLLKAMLGILPLSSGEIFIDGIALRAMKRNEIAKKVAYLSQGKNTPDMTVEQMVLHGRFPYLSYPRRYGEEDRKIAREAMDAVGISKLKNKPLYELSGGMRQTAYIAMALAQDTDYILLDEPTAYLDIAHQLDLMKLLKELVNMGKGVISVMHDIPLALDFSDNIVAIGNGSVVADAMPSKICNMSVIGEMFGVKISQISDNKFYYDY